MDINPNIVIADENRIAAEVDFGGTLKGSLQSVTASHPTDKSFYMRGVFIIDFAKDDNRRISAFRTYYDTSLMFKQLGISLK